MLYEVITRINLIDEDDAGRLFLGLIEHIAHARGTDTDESYNFV